jgi:hypothetical protein
MGAKRFVVVLSIFACGAQISWAGDAIDSGVPIFEAAAVAASSVETSATISDEIQPWIHPGMSDAVREKLDTAFRIAIDHISTVEECADLFHSLGADPFETLKTGLYFPANVVRETSMCRRSYAQTYVGDAPTWICSRITAYSDEQAAMVIIHEALHHAGLPERPQDRKAMSSAQINDMVRDRCGL